VGSRSRARARAKASQPPAGVQPPARKQATATTRQALRPAASGSQGDGRPDAPAAAPGPLPLSVRIAAIVQLAEAVGVLVAALMAGIDAISGKAYQHASGIAITVIGIGTALALAYVARGLNSGRRWSRTPAVLTQLFVAIVAIYLVQAPRLDWGIPAIVLAVGGTGALLAPDSLRVLTPGRIEKP
jgi:peptidoglycan/LPS O-acetylase OafA/YrhL